MKGKVVKKKSIRKYPRGDKEGTNRTHQTFVIRRFKQQINEYKNDFSWLRNKNEEEYPALTRYVLKLNWRFKGKRILKLAFIPNFGYKNGKLHLKGLGKKNAAFELFQKQVRGLSADEVNRQRVQNCQLLSKLNLATINCSSTEEKNQDVEVKTYSRQQIKKNALQFRKNKNLAQFVQELIEGKKKKKKEEDSKKQYIQCDDDLECYESQTPQIKKRVTRSKAKILSNVSCADDRKSFQMQSDIRENQVQQMVPSQRYPLQSALLTQRKRSSLVSKNKQLFHDSSKLPQKDLNCLKPDPFDEEKPSYNSKMLQDEQIQTLFNRKRKTSYKSNFYNDFVEMTKWSICKYQ